MELGAVELGFQQERREIVARLCEMFGDTRIDVAIEVARVDLRLSLLRGRVDVLEHHANEPAKGLRVGLREAEHLRDHSERDVLRVVDSRVELFLARSRIEQFIAERAREWLECGNRLRAERRQQQSARQRMKRRGWAGRGG